MSSYYHYYYYYLVGFGCCFCLFIGDFVFSALLYVLVLFFKDSLLKTSCLICFSEFKDLGIHLIPKFKLQKDYLHSIATELLVLLHIKLTKFIQSERNKMEHDQA